MTTDVSAAGQKSVSPVILDFLVAGTVVEAGRLAHIMTVRCSKGSLEFYILLYIERAVAVGEEEKAGRWGV